MRIRCCINWLLLIQHGRSCVLRIQKRSLIRPAENNCSPILAFIIEDLITVTLGVITSKVDTNTTDKLVAVAIVPTEHLQLNNILAGIGSLVKRLVSSVRNHCRTYMILVCLELKPLVPICCLRVLLDRTSLALACKLHHNVWIAPPECLHFWQPGRFVHMDGYSASVILQQNGTRSNFP